MRGGRPANKNTEKRRGARRTHVRLVEHVGVGVQLKGLAVEHARDDKVDKAGNDDGDPAGKRRMNTGKGAAGGGTQGDTHLQNRVNEFCWYRNMVTIHGLTTPGHFGTRGWVRAPAS